MHLSINVKELRKRGIGANVSVENKHGEEMLSDTADEPGVTIHIDLSLDWEQPRSKEEALINAKGLKNAFNVFNIRTHDRQVIEDRMLEIFEDEVIQAMLF